MKSFSGKWVTHPAAFSQEPSHLWPSRASLRVFSCQMAPLRGTAELTHQGPFPVCARLRQDFPMNSCLMGQRRVLQHPGRVGVFQDHRFGKASLAISRCSLQGYHKAPCHAPGGRGKPFLSGLSSGGFWGGSIGSKDLQSVLEGLLSLSRD